MPPIDWYSFLGRPRLPSPHPEALEPLRQASILVTGAGGSIGTSLSLRLAALGARKLVLLDVSEQALFRLQTLLAGSDNRHICAVLGSIADAAHLDELFASHRFDFVYHAAAYKHLPLLEQQPLAALANNALGTHTLVQAILRHPGARLVLLSTDKAVEPLSILGASKRVAELIALSARGTVVRLANVLGTSGSVVEVFLSQILAGRPVTVTDRNAERYFLTSEEAVDLLLAGSLREPCGDLLVPRLERRHSILSLANFLIRELSPKAGLPIAFIPPRLGERSTESLWSADERPDKRYSNCPFGSYIELRSPLPGKIAIARSIERLQSSSRLRDLAGALESVRELVPTYTPRGVPQP